MSMDLLDELIIPAEHGRSIEVKKGQTLRMIAIEGPQVVDITFLNAYDYRESYNGPQSYNLNCRLGYGDGRTLKYLYSCLPWSNIMMEITDDKVGRHWVINGGHCSWKSNVARGLPKSSRSCHGNLADALHYHGLTSDRVPDSFPLWMKIEYGDKGEALLYPSPAKKGDYTDFMAHMDVLVAISACPGNQGNITNINGDNNKPVKAEVWG